eukprot:Cvel_23223.t1-p1 / transcript=Cvel_23223.t1 / gene=Cvel_23223 / organism=Chromera_velia_CCMP2878 / gene_product=hypothetical protein / transcript_product=hypothetical protein / location=Cvel_scaffold2369:21127-26019(+) / protein_length=119 / sequence_SO=supercontig / SO=protein_coding / is_pseudo=false
MPNSDPPLHSSHYTRTTLEMPLPPTYYPARGRHATTPSDPLPSADAQPHRLGEVGATVQVRLYTQYHPVRPPSHDFQPQEKRKGRKGASGGGSGGQPPFLLMSKPNKGSIVDFYGQGQQ